MIKIGKSILCVALAVLLVCSLASCGTPKTSPGEAFVGTWVCGRASLEITQDGEDYKCRIHWGSSAFESTQWEYTCHVDESGALVAEGTGVKQNVVFNENGTEVYTDDVYGTGSAKFELLENGKLVWKDAEEDAGADMEFERASFVGEVPTQQAFVDDYFHVIGGFLQGTSGSSLKMAQAACEAFRFAVLNRIDILDTQPLRDTMLAAWESMSDEERSAFDANFIDVARLVDGCFDDWEGARGRFDDAGVGEDMAALLANPTAKEAWSSLVGHTLTMGNSEG